MNLIAITFVLAMGVLASFGIGVLTWGLILEARSNRDRRERVLRLSMEKPRKGGAFL